MDIDKNKIERLDKVLSNLGYGSRKDIKKYIKKGLVKVNGETINKNGIKVRPYKDEILFNNDKVDYKEYIYIMLNKPSGYVSSTDDPESETVLELIDSKYLTFNPFPAGRLDKDTEGLLLITNDGKLAHNLLAPKNKVPKVYYAKIYGTLSEEHVLKFENGVILDDGYKTMPSELKIINSDIVSEVEITIYEGKYHQVKRMFESIGMKVLYLKRLELGNLKIDKNLKKGEYRELHEKELENLKSI